MKMSRSVRREAAISILKVPVDVQCKCEGEVFILFSRVISKESVSGGLGLWLGLRIPAPPRGWGCRDARPLLDSADPVGLSVAGTTVAYLQTQTTLF